jgi:hypothetical protein
MTLSDITPARGWDNSKIKLFFDIWDTWHLNDMQAGCQHQRKEWNHSEKLTLTTLSPDSLYWREEDHAKNGKMTGEEYEAWKVTHALCDSAWLKNKPAHPALWSDAIKDLIEKGYLKINKAETKTAGWVNPEEHPDGILCKPCPVCGYKYGTAWLKEELPADIEDQLSQFPNTDVKPAWV